MPNDLLEIAVVRTGIGWRVMTCEWKGGAYRFRIDAEEAALRFANKVRSGGRPVNVLVQDLQGELHPLGLAEQSLSEGAIGINR